MPAFNRGRHEHGQNFLRDQSVVRRIVQLVTSTDGPIVEIGAGGGALTRRLQRLDRPMTCVEIDARLAMRLAARVPAHVRVANQDFLTFRLSTEPHTLVGNLPFHQTTAILRRVLRAPGWTTAVLVLQWEVARRRAGVGGATMMTAQWWPWFTFALDRRVPAAAFHPRPGVDGAILSIQRRPIPLLGRRHRAAYHDFVHRVFTGSGRNMAEVLGRAGVFSSTAQARSWLCGAGVGRDVRPKDLTATLWADLFRASGSSPPARGRSRGQSRGQRDKVRPKAT